MIKQLNNDELENVTGGMIFYAKQISGSEPENPWEVINQNGDVMKRFSSRKDAEDYASSLEGNKELNTMEINWNQLQHLRGIK